MIQSRVRVHGLTGSFPMNFSLYSHRGGASPAFLFPSRSSNRVESLPKFSEQLRTIYKSMVSRLRARNKTLSKDTERKLKEYSHFIRKS